MHKFNHFILPILAALSCDLTALFAETSAAKSQNPRACEIAIVGGGAGGLHTAFRLGPQYGAKVCLFEKEEELGGRIHDLPMNPADPNSPRMGVGARRIMEGQKLLFALAAELGLQLETPELGTDLIQARGMQSFQKDDFVTKYPGMPIKDKPDVDQETWLYDQLRKGPGRQHISEYPELRSYVSAITGTESFD
ncbi:MAG: NAD(P)-binding protein, partial [Proteobacteria bacterium]|nr:NAD(P)-binding protein [Pseudomonadota bacterium]